MPRLPLSLQAALLCSWVLTQQAKGSPRRSFLRELSVSSLGYLERKRLPNPHGCSIRVIAGDVL